MERFVSYEDFEIVRENERKLTDFLHAAEVREISAFPDDSVPQDARSCRLLYIRRRETQEANAALAALYGQTKLLHSQIHHISTIAASTKSDKKSLSSILSLIDHGTSTISYHYGVQKSLSLVRGELERSSTKQERECALSKIDLLTKVSAQEARLSDGFRRVLLEELQRRKIPIIAPFLNITSVARPKSVLRPSQTSSLSQQQCPVRGLLNLGNTCFMNAPLQCLLHTPGFFDRLTNDATTEDFVSPEVIEALLVVFNELRAAGSSTYVDPTAVHKQLHVFAPQLANGKQHDSHEFFNQLLVALGDTFGKDPTSVSQMFDVGLLNTTKCLRKDCDYNSEKREREPCIQVAIDFPSVQPGTVTLLDCLERYQRLEQMNDCVCKCGRNAPTLRQTTFTQFGDVIVFQLLRYGNNLDTLVFTGLGKFLLYGVVNHIGNRLDAGHYIALVKVQEQWYNCDDTVVSGLTNPRSSDAYLLFYRRSA